MALYSNPHEGEADKPELWGEWTAGKSRFSRSLARGEMCWFPDILSPVKTTCRTASHMLQSVSSRILIRPTPAVCWLRFHLVPDCVPHPFLLSCWQMSASLWPQLTGACVVWHRRPENRSLCFIYLPCHSQGIINYGGNKWELAFYTSSQPLKS